jgi:predicted transposase YdaD
VVKEREHRLDGLFQPPADLTHLPVVLLEAQMGADPKFLRRLYAQSAMLVEQEVEIEHWRVVVICPHRHLNFGSPNAVIEFVRERVHWLELEPAATDPAAPPLLRALALLVRPEEEIAATSKAIQAEVAGTDREGAIADVIAAIVVARFNGRSIKELCTMGGITLEDFTQSVAYQEIFGQGRLEGRLEGRQEGRQEGRLEGRLEGRQEGRLEGRQEGRLEGRQEGRLEGELDLTLRQLRRRCGDLTPDLESRIRALSLARLEALAEALLDFQAVDDLDVWLRDQG